MCSSSSWLAFWHWGRSYIPNCKLYAVGSSCIVSTIKIEDMKKRDVWTTHVHPWKLTCHWKITIFNRKYIFIWWMFYCHVSFRGISQLGSSSNRFHDSHYFTNCIQPCYFPTNYIQICQQKINNNNCLLRALSQSVSWTTMPSCAQVTFSIPAKVPMLSAIDALSSAKSLQKFLQCWSEGWRDTKYHGILKRILCMQ